jgi:hypothetical protein
MQVLLSGLAIGAVYGLVGMGSIEQGLLTTEEMYQRVGGEVRRLVPFHEERMWESFPSQRFDDDLHVAELSIRTGDASRLSARTPAS